MNKTFGAKNLISSGRTPEFTLLSIGIAQIAVGFCLLSGFAERTAVFIATAWMLILIALVASENPWMLTDPTAR